MWDYSDRRDSTRITSDELHEAEIDECMRVITNIKKKSPVPKAFGMVAFSKAFPRTEVPFSSLTEYFFRPVILLIRIDSYERSCLGRRGSSVLSAPTRSG
jgi:hypothetical protein